MSGYTWAWLAWIAAFVAIEGKALSDKDKGDTLSEHVWKWFAVKGEHAKAGQARRAALAMFLAWLSAHFITGGRI